MRKNGRVSRDTFHKKMYTQGEEPYSGGNLSAKVTRKVNRAVPNKTLETLKMADDTLKSANPVGEAARK